jgi:hypothetical protein
MCNGDNKVGNQAFYSICLPCVYFFISLFSFLHTKCADTHFVRKFTFLSFLFTRLPFWLLSCWLSIPHQWFSASLLGEPLWKPRLLVMGPTCLLCVRTLLSHFSSSNLGELEPHSTRKFGFPVLDVKEEVKSL